MSIHMNRRIVAILASAALVGACGDSTGVPDLNNVSAETIQGGLTTASGQLLATGLFNQHRNSATGNYVTFPGTMARDALRMDKAEPRYLSEIIGSVQPDNGAFTGQGVFAAFFIGIRSANTLLDAVAAAGDASGYNAAGRSGLTGVAQTIKALNYWNVMEMRDSIGMPIDLNRSINADPAPWICKRNVLAYVSALLDSGSTSLSAAGTAFQFTVPPGYSAVAGTPAGFNQFNRGLKAKVELYRALSHAADAPTGGAAASLAAALTAINASFMSPTAPMATGVFQNYSTATGETQNSRVDAALHLNDAVFDSLQAGDLRGAKIVRTSTPYNIQISGTTVVSSSDFAQSLGSASLTAPLPILKNEELLLLRAQIAIELNDLATATTYMNYVRTTSGGLAPYAVFATQAAARSALLYEKRYSLLMEGPHRLLDLRAYSRLNATSFLPGSKSSPFPGDVFTSALPIPINELNARGGSVAMTCQ
jgi:starch-binding outer membrane protein, SusD/RagB family